MAVLTRAGEDILRADGHRNSGVYRGILELLSRYGYLSIREVMYGFQLRTQEAINRLFYLEKSGFIERFPSLAHPDSFFCLTPLGRQAVMGYGICNHVQEFYPSRYAPTYQNHNRALIRIYLAIKRLFAADFHEWKTEMQLKHEGGETSGFYRVLDGEFAITIHKQKYEEVGGALKLIDATSEKWNCGFELELTVKSTKRYEKQFHVLSKRLYDLSHKDRLPLILFLCGTSDIYERLAKRCVEKSKEYPLCVFLLGQMDRFLENPGEAPLIKIVGGAWKKILAKDLNRVRVMITS